MQYNERAVKEDESRMNEANPNTDTAPGREGGDEALADSSPNDSRSDEKVIVNEQRGNKTVNAPSQTGANTSEADSNDEEIIDDSEETDE